jgi:hypothetical protein
MTTLIIEVVLQIRQGKPSNAKEKEGQEKRRRGRAFGAGAWRTKQFGRRVNLLSLCYLNLVLSFYCLRGHSHAISCMKQMCRLWDTEAIIAGMTPRVHRRFERLFKRGDLFKNDLEARMLVSVLYWLGGT